MPLHLHGGEHRLVDYLKANGLKDPQATFYTVILCRQYRAPREELISLLEYHLPVLPSSRWPVEQQIAAALDDLVQRGLVERVDGEEAAPLRARNPWQTTLAEQLSNKKLDAEMGEIISDFLRNLAELSLPERSLIERLGRAGWEASRKAFREGIGQAHQRIRLGVYSSKTVFEEIKKEIKEVMIRRHGIEVQILMFSPKLAAKIESNPDLARDVQNRTEDWKHLYVEAKREAKRLGHNPKLEIRHLHDERMVAFHRVLLVDDRRWLMNVHRPRLERGIDGIVYQGFCDERGPSNLYTLLDYYWSAAWESGADPSLPSEIFHKIKRYQHLVLLPGLVFLGIYALKDGGNWLGMKNDWWGGAIVGVIIAELYNNRSMVMRDVLQGLKRLLTIVQSNLLGS